ncbi:MAG TPA: class I SAM-dependent DNA methyltransferase [Vicinamibacterales bacterium]|nr:class I SAM-dependent DNA methyltransferase [Vicinamibacterales bacterium]
MTHGEIVSFLWSVADLIRDTFRRGRYQDIILPLTVLRRLDCVLEPTRDKVRKKAAELTARKLENPDKQLRKASGFAFYNTSQYDFERLIGDAPQLAANLRNYIAGFSQNMREVIEKFDFDNTITKLDEAGLLFQVVERFKNVNLHPDVIDNATMGTVFEELIRKFNEALDENPGEHFTPRDVVHLMVDLLIAGDETSLARHGVTTAVLDPCCGTGGMLTIFKEHVAAGVRKNGELVRAPINAGADIHLFGQEVNPETFAVCKSDLFIKSEDGRDAENIKFGSTLSNDKHDGKTFDYLIANPPYGKDWKRDETAVRAEHERGEAGRFGPGLPRISDGQLLFLLHMLARMRAPEHGGARVAIIMNGSPLFTGDAVSGESEIRRHVFEQDWLEALIALPEQLFYNTGIATYVWVITNRKAAARRGKVQLIDATSFWAPMRKSLGDKRREVPLDRAREIVALLERFEEGEHVRIYPTSHFGYRKVTVERPLRLNFQASADRITRLDEETAFKNLALSKKKDPAVRTREEAAGRAEQDRIRQMVRGLPPTLYKNRSEFEQILQQTADAANVELSSVLPKAITSALSERDETADVCQGKDGRPEPDPELRDTESVPLTESVEAYFDREVRPQVSDAWIDESRRDLRDGGVGVVGYEVNFNRYFYKYVPPRPVEEIEAEIRAIEKDVVRMLAEVTGGFRERSGPTS